MTKKKATANWRVVDEIPDVPLALYWIDQKTGFEHIMLQSLTDEDFCVQIMHSEKHFSVSIFDPHEVWIEEFNEYGD